MSKVKRAVIFIVSGLAASSALGQMAGPSLPDTIEFMAGVMKSGRTVANKDRTIRDTQTFEGEGCSVTLTDQTDFYGAAGRSQGSLKVIDKFSLADIDPKSMKITDYSDMYLRSTSIELDTTNLREVVVRSSDLGQNVKVSNAGFILGSEYAPKFIEALKHAITLCGGKPSAY